jgi:hypothetical protein
VDWRYAGGGAIGQNAPFISANNLSAAGLPSSVGNGVGFDFSQLGTSRIQISPTALNSGTIYWSALLRVDAIATTIANGMLLGGFNNTPGPGAQPNTVGACLRIKTDPNNSSKFVIGTAMNSGTGAGNVQFETSGHSLGDTVFVVGSYTFVAGSNNDTAQMWINPTPGGAQPAATLTSNPLLADSFASLSTFNLRNVNTAGTATAYFDELRVGDDWASVTPTPEPTTLALLLMGAMPLALRRRTERQS